MRKFRSAAHPDRWQDRRAFDEWLRKADSETKALYSDAFCYGLDGLWDKDEGDDYGPGVPSLAEEEIKGRVEEALQLTEEQIRCMLEDFDASVARRKKEALDAREKALPLQAKIRAAAALPVHARSNEQVQLCQLLRDLNFQPSVEPDDASQPEQPNAPLMGWKGYMPLLLGVGALVLLYLYGIFVSSCGGQ